MKSLFAHLEVFLSIGVGEGEYVVRKSETISLPLLPAYLTKEKETTTVFRSLRGTGDIPYSLLG
jgi:hypothetical protein